MPGSYFPVLFIFVCWVILDCRLGIIIVRLWRLWILLYSSKKCWHCISKQLSWLAMDCKLYLTYGGHQLNYLLNSFSLSCNMIWFYPRHAWYKGLGVSKRPCLSLCTEYMRFLALLLSFPGFLQHSQVDVVSLGSYIPGLQTRQMASFLLEFNCLVPCCNSTLCSCYSCKNGISPHASSFCRVLVPIQNLPVFFFLSLSRISKFFIF